MGKASKNNTTERLSRDECKHIILDFVISQFEIIKSYRGQDDMQFNIVFYDSSSNSLIQISEWDIRLVHNEQVYTIIPGAGDPIFTYGDALKCLIAKAEDFVGESFHDLVPGFNTTVADI